MITNEQLRRLPKAARNEVMKLRADVQYLLDRLKSFEGEKSKVYFTNHQATFYIPEDDTVIFEIGDTKIDCSIRNGRLHIAGEDGVIRIQPYATNVIDIWSEKYR